ncbi:hypothetical protein GNF07_26170, partial [Trichormus variabilis FSR]|nr:hypothetical protein [Trichormus variabilis FSR]
NIAFHAKNGEILSDKLGLANEIKQNLTQVAEPVQKSLSIEDLKKQVEALQQKVQDQQAVIDRFVQQENSSVESTQKLSTDLANL